jgi:hypothetical protein
VRMQPSLARSPPVNGCALAYLHPGERAGVRPRPLQLAAGPERIGPRRVASARDRFASSIPARRVIGPAEPRMISH